MTILPKEICRLNTILIKIPIVFFTELAEIILKACAYNPKDRYESATDMKRALESVLYEESLASVAYPKGDKLGNQSFEYSNSLAKKEVFEDSEEENTQLLSTGMSNETEVLQPSDFVRRTPEEVKQDLEGMQTMRTLGENMAWLLRCIEAGRAAGVAKPVYEEKVATNFIR